LKDGGDLPQGQSGGDVVVEDDDLGIGAQREKLLVVLARDHDLPL